jgi:hypothetical protein
MELEMRIGWSRNSAANDAVFAGITGSAPGIAELVAQAVMNALADFGRSHRG